METAMNINRNLVIVPAFNEEESIKAVIEQIYAATQNLDNIETEVIVINDGSSDHTSRIAREAGSTVIDLLYNLGIGGAVQTGFKYAYQKHFDIAIQIDGDGQHDPSFISDLTGPIIRQEADVVIGSRFLNKNDGFKSTIMRRMGIKIFYWVNTLIIRQKITDNTSGFRAYNKRAIAYLQKNYPSDYPEPEAVVMLGLKKIKIVEIPVTMLERQGGQSSITFFKSIFYMVKVLLAIFIDVLKKR
jgi:glycosyltransferase involved in cell wall biosynthesis